MRSVFRIIIRTVRSYFSPYREIIQAVKPFTMLSDERLNMLLKLSTEIIKNQIPGAFVECGTCRGGSGALLAWAAQHDERGRHVYLFDSFQGHPSFASEHAPDREEVTRWAGTMVASQEDVRLALRSVNVQDLARVHIVPGWFQDSIPAQNIPQIALLHLDADWYDSTLFCLQALYSRVVTDGHIVVDDYHYLEGCRQAVDTFFSAHWSEVEKHSVGVALVLHKKN